MLRPYFAAHPDAFPGIAGVRAEALKMRESLCVLLVEMANVGRVEEGIDESGDVQELADLRDAPHMATASESDRARQEADQRVRGADAR